MRAASRRRLTRADSIVSAKQNASRFGYSISGNRELVALGAGNVGAACISGSIVGFGSITRSRLNANAGARTPMSSLICAGLVTLATFLLVQYIYHLPMAVLGSIGASAIATRLTAQSFSSSTASCRRRPRTCSSSFGSARGLISA